MAGINKEQARKILEKNGYTVLGYLGAGAASHAFKASRKSKKDPAKEKIVAAKVCCPQKNSWASLKDELNAAAELKKLKEDFKSNLRKAKQNGNDELVKEYEKKSKYLFKYLTVPKLKLQPLKEIIDDGEEHEIAIFEAPLADTDLYNIEIESYDPNTSKLAREPHPNRPGRNRTVVSDLNVNYSELKKAIKGILKGLKTIHDQGMSHGDIRLNNILRKPGATEGKYRYSVTDFGTLKTKSTAEERQKDLQNASRMLLALWLKCVGVANTDIHATVMTTLFENYCKELLKNNSDVSVLIPPDYEFRGVYHPTAKDKGLIAFCLRLYEGKSADGALTDLWLK